MAMARPMGRPSSPPFALITVVVLLIIAVAVAVALAVQVTKKGDDYDKALAQAKRAEASAVEARTTLKSVADRLSVQARAYSERADAGDLLKEMAALLDNTPRDPGARDGGTYKDFPTMFDAVKKIIEARDDLHNRAVQSEKERAALQDTVSEKQQTITKMEEELRNELLVEARKNAAALEQWKKDVDGLQAKIELLSNELTEVNGEMERLKIRQVDKENEWQTKVSRLNNELAKALAELRRLNRVTIDEFMPAKDPDGSVIQVYPDVNMVYLKLVRPEQGRLGMRYVIFTKGARIPDSGQGKAVVEIASMQNNTVQAKIITSAPGDPILMGDTAINLVTGPTIFNFVVAGQFDLNNDDVVEPNGKSQIEGLIGKWGGKVQDDIDISTNFVVLGRDPGAPAGAPPPEADALVKADYERMKAEHDHWISLKDRAGAFTIPVLNEETFLHWVGYYNPGGGTTARSRERPGESWFNP